MNTQELVKALQDERFNKSAERAEALANKLSNIIIEKMEDLNMVTIQGKTRGYEIEITRSNAGHYEKYLVDDSNGEGIAQYGGYLGGDFNAYIKGAKRKTNIEFLKNFKSLVEAIAEEQERLIKKTTEIIREAEDIAKSLEQED